ncbi:MAG: cytochrome c [Candidatus Zixiibacteriota bacterium]
MKMIGYYKVLSTAYIILMSLIVLMGCARERPSGNPPIHLNPNMDDQEKVKPQSANSFFEDGASMRNPVAGTIARGDLRDDDEFYLGKNDRGDFIRTSPIDVDMEILKRGRERFDIYCSPCHSRLGDGKGIMIKKGYLPPPSFHDDRIREMPAGQIFDVVTNGVRNMPAYAHQIPVNDRWAIITYLRALQKSQNSKPNDVPEELREKIRQGNQ